MKILFLHRWVGVHGGGTETHLLELARRFSALGHQITVLTRAGGRLYDLDGEIKVIRVGKALWESEHSYEDARVYLYTAIYMLKVMLKLFLLNIRGERFDVISVHFAVEAIIARVYRFFWGTPFVFVLEGYTRLEAKTAKAANLRISISNFEANIYKERHSLDSKMIYIGVDLSRFLKDENKSAVMRPKLVAKTEILALTVCRLEPRKDIPTLIEAAKIVNAKNKDIKFVIVGDGISRRDIENNIKQNKLDSVIKLAGYINDSELPKYYGAADMFLLTSKQEWFGIVFLEAMAAGLAIIASNVDAAPEVVNGCGLFFDKGNYKELAEKILFLAGNPGLRNDLSLKSKARAKGFDWDKQALLYEDAYKSALKG